MPRRARFVPKELLRHASDWDSDEPRWKPAGTLDEAARLAVAQAQQRLALRVRDELKAQRQTTGHLASVLGHPDHVRQLLNKLAGTVPARPEDLALWTWFVGETEVPFDVRSIPRLDGAPD